jgi:hypothetical protein
MKAASSHADRDRHGSRAGPDRRTDSGRLSRRATGHQAAAATAAGTAQLASEACQDPSVWRAGTAAAGAIAEPSIMGTL